MAVDNMFVPTQGIEGFNRIELLHSPPSTGCEASAM